MYYSVNRNYYETTIAIGDTDWYPSMVLEKIRSGHATLPGNLSTADRFNPPGSGDNEAHSNTRYSLCQEGYSSLVWEVDALEDGLAFRDALSL